MQIRPAIEADRLALFKLAAAMHSETDFAGLQFDPAMALDGLGRWVHSSEGLMLVAADAGEVFGMLAATLRRPWFSPEIVVSEDLFFVRQDKRGGRCAYLLMRAFVQAAQAAGARHLRAGIATGDAGQPADRLYRHFGMRLVGGSYSLYFDRKQP